MPKPIPFPETMLAYDKIGTAHRMSDVYDPGVMIPDGYEAIGFGSARHHAPFMGAGMGGVLKGTACHDEPRILLRKVETNGTEETDPKTATPPTASTTTWTPIGSATPTQPTLPTPSYPTTAPLYLTAPLQTRDGRKVRNVRRKLKGETGHYPSQPLIGEYQYEGSSNWATSEWHETGQFYEVYPGGISINDLIYRPIDTTRVRRTRDGKPVKILKTGCSAEQGYQPSPLADLIRGRFVNTNGTIGGDNIYWTADGRYRYWADGYQTSPFDLVEEPVETTPPPTPEPTERPKVVPGRSFKRGSESIYLINTTADHKLSTLLRRLPIVTVYNKYLGTFTTVILHPDDRCDFTVACQYAFLKAIRKEPLRVQHELFAKFLDTYYEPVTPESPKMTETPKAVWSFEGLTPENSYSPNILAAVPWHRVIGFRPPATGDLFVARHSPNYMEELAGFCFTVPRLILRPAITPDTVDPVTGKSVRGIYGEDMPASLPYHRAVRFGCPKVGETFCSWVDGKELVAMEQDEAFFHPGHPRLIVTPAAPATKH